MDFLGNAAIWIVDKTAMALEWVDDIIVPAWNRMIYGSDMLLILGPPLILVLGLICLIVTTQRISEGKGRAAKEMEKALNDDKKSDVGLFYSLVFKLFYFPMPAYFFLLYSPFGSVNRIAVEETIFYNFRELTEGFQFVGVYLMLRFVGMVVSNAVRLRFARLFKFLLYTACCAVIGTYLHMILAALSAAGDRNLLFALISVIVNFIFSTIPMVYFWVAMLIPIYELIMPLLAPFALIFGFVLNHVKQEQDFRDWMFNNHFFAWVYFLVDR